MALTCPRCSATLDGAGLESTGRCPFCGTVLFVVQGIGIPHRIVSSCRSEKEILRAASGEVRRAGRTARPGSVTIYFIPYYVSEGAPGAQGWTGHAAVSLPASFLSKIPIFGSDTRWFDPGAAPPGARVLEPTLDASEAAPGEKILELRYVPIAHVVCENGAAKPLSFWIDAERGRILEGAGASEVPRVPARGLNGWLLVTAAIGGAISLLVPFPWSVPPIAAVGFALYRYSRSHLTVSPR